MNKRALAEDFREIGMQIQLFEFSNQGYTIDLKLDITKANGWEDLENLPISGIEMAKIRTTGAYTRRVQFIPNNRKEFVDYVKKHMKYFGAGKRCALSDLQELIEKYGSKNAKIAIKEYLKSEVNAKK